MSNTILENQNCRTLASISTTLIVMGGILGLMYYHGDPQTPICL